MKPQMNTDKHRAAHPQPNGFHRRDTEGTEISQSSQAATKNFTAETLVMRKNRSAGVSPACEPG